MKARYFVIVTLVALLAIAQGCRGDSVSDDLIEYQNHGIVPLDSLIDKRRESLYKVSKKYSPSRGEVVRALRDVIPTQERLLAKLHALRPRTVEVRELHLARLDYEGHFLEMLRLRLRGLEQRDRSLITQSVEIGKQALEEEKRLVTRNNQLAQRYGLTVDAR